MTVRELITKLEKLPPNQKVVVSEHSQYSEVLTVEPIVAFDNGGYYSHPFREEDQLRAHGVVYLGT